MDDLIVYLKVESTVLLRGCDIRLTLQQDVALVTPVHVPLIV